MSTHLFRLWQDFPIWRVWLHLLSFIKLISHKRRKLTGVAFLNPGILRNKFWSSQILASSDKHVVMESWLLCS